VVSAALKKHVFWLNLSHILMHVSFFQIVTYGAVVSYLNVTDRAFENYANGIYSGCTSKSINHAVLVIGYGVENGKKYWLVKNSWGTTWGIDGTFKILRGNNECGIGMYCYAAKCEKTSGPLTDPPGQPPPGPLPAQQECNVTMTFGPITGSRTLNFRGIFFVQ